MPDLVPELSWQSLTATVNWALNAYTPTERQRRAVDTVAWMREHATYTQRAQTILETVGLA